jgi:hypothetical protein
MFIRVPPSEPTYKEILIGHDPQLDAVELCRHVGSSGKDTPSGHDATDPIYVNADLATDAANSDRSTVTQVLPTQHVGADGKPMPSGTATDPLYTAGGLAVSTASTARDATTLVLPVQQVDATGKPLPVHHALGAAAGTNLVELVGNGASQIALPANANRTHGLIGNTATSTTPIWLGMGVAAEQNKGIRLDPGSTKEIDDDWYFAGAVSFWGAATATIFRWEA